MLGYKATAESGDPSPAPHSEQRDGWTEILNLDPGTCPKCFAPIEPERLPEAELCLDCNVVR